MCVYVPGPFFCVCSAICTAALDHGTHAATIGCLFCFFVSRHAAGVQRTFPRTFSVPNIHDEKLKLSQTRNMTSRRHLLAQADHKRLLCHACYDGGSTFRPKWALNCRRGSLSTHKIAGKFTSFFFCGSRRVVQGAMIFVLLSVG